MSDRNNPTNDFQPGQVANRAQRAVNNAKSETTQTIRATSDSVRSNVDTTASRVNDTLRSNVGNTANRVNDTLRSTTDSAASRANVGGSLDDIRSQVQESERTVTDHATTARDTVSNTIGTTVNSGTSAVNSSVSDASRNVGMAVQSGSEDVRDSSGMGALTWILVLALILIALGAAYYFFIR